MQMFLCSNWSMWQICRVEDITVEGLIKGSVVHFHLARTVVIRSSGTITADGMGKHTHTHCRFLFVNVNQFLRDLNYGTQDAKGELGQVGF